MVDTDHHVTQWLSCTNWQFVTWLFQPYRHRLVGATKSPRWDWAVTWHVSTWSDRTAISTLEFNSKNKWKTTPTSFLRERRRWNGVSVITTLQTNRKHKLVVVQRINLNKNSIFRKIKIEVNGEIHLQFHRDRLQNSCRGCEASRHLDLCLC
jgi:hypothetical protein